MSRCLSLLLLSVFICYVASSSLPTMLNLTSNTTQQPNAEASCTPFKLFQLRPHYRDCDHAVNALSASRLPGHFHSEGPMDDWQLPIIETAGTCEILLKLLPFSLPEPSSWQELKAVARKLNEECRVGVPLEDVSGGAITAGPHGRILISMVRTTRGLKVADG